MTPLSEPNEDYLERIFELLKEKGFARVSDIAQRLKIKPASVTKMVQKLSRSGFIVYESYRGFTLTKLGKEIGNRINKRHMVLFDFLTLLGLPEKTALNDIEGLEHHLSDATLRALEKMVIRLRKEASLKS